MRNCGDLWRFSEENRRISLQCEAMGPWAKRGRNLGDNEASGALRNRPSQQWCSLSSPFLQCGPEGRDQNSGDASRRKASSDPDWESPYAHDSDLGPRKSTQEPKMPRKKSGKKNKRVALPVLNPDAAGIDIGATEIYVAVPADRPSRFVVSPRSPRT
jgi:hypothetical protein